MPKTKKNKGKQKEISQKEILELLKKTLKKIPEPEEPNEEEINKNINIASLEFHNFFHSDEDDSEAPVLERIVGRQIPQPIFVGQLTKTTSISGGEKNSEDELKYMPNDGGASEPKYLSQPETVRGKIERIRLEDIGRRREFLEQTNQELLYESSSEARIFNQTPQIERFERVESFDITKVNRQPSFERAETKYEKYKSKLVQEK